MRRETALNESREIFKWPKNGVFVYINWVLVVLTGGMAVFWGNCVH